MSKQIQFLAGSGWRAEFSEREEFVKGESQRRSRNENL
jgi:hypothetical protein